MKLFEYSEQCLLTFLNISNVVVVADGHGMCGDLSTIPIYNISIKDDRFLQGKSPYGKVSIDRSNNRVTNFSYVRARKIAVFGFDEFFLKRYWFIYKNL